MKLDKNNAVKKAFFIAVAVLILFIAALMQASSEEEMVKYSDMEKEEIGDDDESQNALKEYSAELLGTVKKDVEFNTIATQGDIAVLNVTIDGKDTRILTRLRTATISSGQNLLNATLIRTMNLVVLGNISLKGNLFFDAEESFGLRRFYGIGSTTSKYIDEGFARLVNGKANVSVNPVLRELISSYNVFLSAEGLTKGIYVAEKTDSYFVVKSVNAKSNVGFSWMLSGVKQDFNEKLGSEYGKEKSIGIIAEIDFETGSTKVKITGLDKILGLIDLSANGNNSNNSNNQNNNQSINLITGNLIDEFGLETDLGKILGEATPLPNLTESSEETTSTPLDNITVNETTTEETTLDNVTIINETIPETLNNITSNKTITNETSAPEISTLEFTLYSTNEDFIVSQIADVTGLRLDQAKKLVNFVYLQPEDFEDEVIEDVGPSLDFIEKVNGSVVIRLG